MSVVEILLILFFTPAETVVTQRTILLQADVGLIHACLMRRMESLFSESEPLDAELY